MTAAFAEWPEAVPTTMEIAERCSVDIELGKMLIPSYPTPDERPEGEYLRELALVGLSERYGDPIPAEAMERLDMELEVIGRMGFDAYFLIVWDFVKYAKDHGIAVGPGVARRPARSSPTRWTSPRSTRSSTACCSSASSTPSACPCPTSTSTSRSRAGPRSCATWRASTGASPWPRSSPSARCCRATPPAMPRACWARTTRWATAWPSSSPSRSWAAAPSLDKYLAQEPEFKKCLRHGPRGARGHRHRPRPGGHRSQRRRARRRGGHRRPPAHRHRAAPAHGGPGRGLRGRRAGLQGRHPVLHGPDRGAGPAQDGLPGPAQPRRDRGLPGHHRGGRRRAARHGHAAARRPQDVRDDGPRRLHRRVPVRVRRHARGAAPGRAHRVRGPRGPQCPVPPGRDGPHRHVRAQQAQPGRDPLHRRAAQARSPRPPTG